MYNADNAKMTFDQLTLSTNGSNRLAVMIGAKNFAYDSEAKNASFRFTAKARNKANYCKITLNGKDLYDVEFFYIRGANCTRRSIITDMYFEDLKGYFEGETGLYLSL